MNEFSIIKTPVATTENNTNNNEFEKSIILTPTQTQNSNTTKTLNTSNDDEELNKSLDMTKI